jgi:excisionase family DNA binding protein
MAGTFYTLQEVTKKLGKSEQDVRVLVRQGKIREYRDGTRILYKQDEVDKLSGESDIIDIVADSEANLELEKTAEIQLEPDEDAQKKKPASEGGFGLSQIGDLSQADTNIGTVGINVLGGTDDQYKITADTHAETKAAEQEEVESLDADANLESVGSGSGLLDLSLQADDTSLGAVLDDILPTGPDIPAQAEATPGDFAKEADGLIAAPAAVSEQAVAEAIPVAAPVVEAATAVSAAPQMITMVPVDPSTVIYGMMMFFPLAALILAGIATAAGLQGVLPSVIKFLSYGGIATLNWGSIIAVVFLLAVLIFSIVAAIAGSRRAKS